MAGFGYKSSKVNIFRSNYDFGPIVTLYFNFYPTFAILLINPNYEHN